MDASNPASSDLPRRLWIFDRNSLQEGDVLLELGESLKSRMIARLDGGRFSHALIWVGNSDFVEAVSGGVRNIAYMRVLIQRPDNWLLLRHSDSLVGKRAAIAARGLVAKGYDLLGALGSKSSVDQPRDPEALFCSQLIAEAYLEAGLELVIGVPSNRVTPKSLLESERFEHKLPQLVELLSSELPSAQAFVNRDAAYRNSLPAKGAHIEREAFQSAKPLLAGLVDPRIPGVRFPPGNLSELLDFLRSIPPQIAEPIEENVLKSLLSSNYFNLLDTPMHETRDWITDQAIQLRYSARTQEQRDSIRSRLETELQGWGQSVDHHKRNADVCREMLRWHPHALWERLADMYTTNATRFMALRALASDFLSIKGPG